MSKIKILIADDIEETRSLIVKLLSIKEDEYEVVAQASNGQEAIDLIPKFQPDIILMDINMPLLNGLEAAEIIESKYPRVMIIMMSVQSDNEYLKKAMFLGAKDYIVKPFTFEQVVESIDNTYKKYHDKIAALKSEKEYYAKILSFFSTKGGVGKSVLASNYALLLGKDPAVKVLIWDLDLQFGDQALLFDKQHGKVLSDLIDEAAYSSMEDADEFIEKITENVHLLCAPTSPEKAEFISRDSIMQLMDTLRTHYDYILLDLGVNYDEITLAALDLCDKVFFITTPDLLALKNTKLGMNVMKSLNYEDNKVNLIVNQYASNCTIKQNQIEELLHTKVLTLIPEESREYTSSVNLGQPLMLNPKYKNLALYKSLIKIEM